MIINNSLMLLPWCIFTLWHPYENSVGLFQFVTPGVNQPGLQADHFLSVGAKVKNVWFYASLPHMPSCYVQTQLYLFHLFEC
jgi:hypothetical protein